MLSAAGLVAGYALGLATWVRPALVLFLYRGVAANGRTAVSRVERSVVDCAVFAGAVNVK